MADGKPDLPEDLLLPKPSDRSWTGKVHALGGTDEKVDESKDQMASENIPLSPQWLYAKPSDAKLDSRFPPSDPNQKEAWRLDGSQDKKDWRRIVTENESNRRWREEERETCLLSARRDRRKGERPNVASREAAETKAMPSPDRWHDGNIRNPGHESRRDNKWSSRWGPEEKEKESLSSEKRTDTEKEKDDSHKENQSLMSISRPISDRDPDSSRDKWRPRHRMDIHFGGSTTSRTAPGFGLDRGKTESHNVGFAVGRGRATFMGRSSSAGLIGVHPLKDESIPGKPKVTTATFCYPRGKLLDIYRSHKFDNTSFIAIPDGMEEEPPLTQADLVEPLAFVAPVSEEEGVLHDIWRGKITSSGVAYNSFKQGRTSENVSEAVESSEKKQGMLSHILSGGTLKEAADDDAYIASVAGKEVASEGGCKLSSATLPSVMGDGSEDLTSFGRKGWFPDDSSSFQLSSSDENYRSHGQQLESRMEAKSLRAAPEELTLFYVDPQGNMQGPFLGADIISWFRQGFFGTDLLVRVGDSSDGAPFQELGTIMPHLKVDTQANIDDQTFMLEQSNSFGGELEAVHASGSILKSIDPSTRKLFHESPQFNGITAQHGQSSISELEAKLRFQQSESQSFEDNVAQDEEIVFPGRSGNAYSIVESSRSIHSPIVNSSSHHSLPNELTESSIPNENDNKLHRFGLLWSELEDAQMRQTQSSNIPSGVVRSSTFSGMVDSELAGENWSDIYGKRTFPESDMYRDALAAARLSRMEHESNHFDLSDQLLSQQLRQKQLQQQNILSPHAGLNESFLDHLSSQNLNHQRQLSNHSVPDLEHLVALQMQQQWQLDLQQQQFHQEQKLLQERQQSQAQQALLEQFLHGQAQAPGLGPSHAEAIRSNNALDQVLLEQQQLLRKIQHQSHHASRNFAPSLNQLVQAKFGQAGLQENQRDLYEIIARAQQGNMQSLDHQLLQEEQLHRQFSLGLKRHNEERDLGSMWPADQPNQFLRNSVGNNRVNSSGFSPLDLYHQQQMSSHEEQLSHLERNFSLRDQLQQGLYDHSSSPFERSMSMPGGASGINMEVMNAIAHGRGLDIDEPNMHMQSAGQVGTFSSGLRTHNPHRLVPNQYDARQHANEGHWAESNGKMENDWMENRIQQLQINAERQHRDLGGKIPSENSSSWMSDGLSEDKSRQLLMNLLHQKPGQQSTFDSLERVPSGIFPGSLDRPFSVLAEQEAGPNNTFSVGSYGSSSSERQQMYFADEPGLDSNDRSQFRHGSGFVPEGERFLSRASDNAQATYRDADMSGLLSMTNELSDGNFKQGGRTSVGERDIPVNILSRHSSLGVAGGNAGSYNDQIGLMNSYIKESTKDRVQVPVKAQENMLLRRPPVHASSSKEGSLEFASDPAGRVKNSSSGNNGKRDPESSDTMAKKDMRFRRTSSYGEGDLSEASFIDMLKSNSKKSAVPEAHSTTGAESSDAAQGGKGGKKKGKKGRQIDPALLGFKVTSNRILMGEIQRADD